MSADMDSHLDRLQHELASAVRGMTIEQLDYRPGGFPDGHPDRKWSTAEVLEHLYLTYVGTRKGFERCLQSGKPLASPVTFAQRLKIALVIHLGYFPKGRKSPERATPKGTPTDKVMAEIGSQISTMGESIAKCEARYGSRTRVLDHPVLGPLTAPQWRKFHWIHGRHHLKQILKQRNSVAKDALSTSP
jgi:Protein of unknown function (DUF1569)